MLSYFMFLHAETVFCISLRGFILYLNNVARRTSGDQMDYRTSLYLKFG